MARLGTVLGGMLAELARARVIADQLSKEFVATYREDPILASLSVPRVVVDEAALTLRFSISDLEELPEKSPDADSVRTAWVREAAPRVLARVVEQLGVPPEEQPTTVAAIKETVGTLAGVPPLKEVRRAVAGDSEGVLAATASPLLEGWDALPAPVRSSLGTKAEFRGALERELDLEFDVLLKQRRDLEMVRAVLQSRIDVAVQPDELPADPGLVQEFRITVRCQDVELLLIDAQEKG